MNHTRAFGGLLLTCLPLLAAQADEAELNPVTVTGTRVPTDLSRAPLIIDTIDRDDAVLGTASRVEDVLSRQPGLHVAGQGRRNGQTLSMRGFGSNGVLVRLESYCQILCMTV
ncbi:TonB-dependent receptor plug domain-containing protein [Halomonas llamarensis]|uniref:Plug domain-containing protein n=1 Tax=Halomonas llamarensis TaxID=2945104 RepID=A0ABT0SVL7_9GAMM|nr:Plug domain-containing protein [Halomonas llamarensis]MCL7931781.1 Plug domain-containing protein [Halomonas llamarensis]